jgi:hypothetical protein
VIVIDDVALWTNASSSASPNRMARSAVTGPCVAGYGPLATGNSNTANVPTIVSKANADATRWAPIENDYATPQVIKPASERQQLLRKFG